MIHRDLQQRTPCIQIIHTQKTFALLPLVNCLAFFQKVVKYGSMVRMHSAWLSERSAGASEAGI